jgi:hypothetical protein
MAGLVLLTGCGHPFIPASALPDPPGQSPATARPAAHTAPAIAPAPAGRAKTLLGVDLYAATDRPLPVVTSYGTADIAYLHRVLGAQAVGLVWNLTAPADHADTVAASARTLSAAAVAELTRLARRAGMSVQYRPIIRVGPPAGWNNPGRSWEGHIQPAHPRLWFGSLFRAELPYLRAAQRLHVSEFVVGTELRGIGNSTWWPWFLAKIRSVYHGTVSYAAFMHQYFTLPQQLPQMPQLGVDAYPSLSLPVSASQAQVTAGWERYLSKVPVGILQRTAMDELSIPALAGAYLRPQDWNAPGATDLQVQSRWFTAACMTAAHFHMRAVYFYDVGLSSDPAHAPAFPASFAGKPGGRAIRGCLRLLRPGRVTGRGSHPRTSTAHA